MSPVAPGDFVMVEYHGRDKLVSDVNGQREVVRDDESPLVLMWNSRKYPVPVGGKTHVPFEAAANAFGDPRAAAMMGSYKDEAGNVGFILDRATEVRRLRTLYDNQVGPENQVLYAPDVTVSDLEGNVITTVLDDPEGETTYPVTTTAVDKSQLEAQIAKMQRTIELLAAQQGLDLSNPNLTPQEPDRDPNNPDDPFVPESVTEADEPIVDGGGVPPEDS